MLIICTQCHQAKEESEFYKDCKKINGLRSSCKDCDKIKSHNPERRKYQTEKMREWRLKHPDRMKAIDRKYKDTHKEVLKKRYKIYSQKNKSKINKHRKLRRQSDPFFKMKNYIRTRIAKIFRRMSLDKPKNTIALLGTDYDIVKQHIENQFRQGMNWENYGRWEIDHIIPLASAKDLDELIALCHYSNLQPLWAEENRVKQDKILTHYINN